MSEVLTLPRLTLCPVPRSDAVFVLDHWADPAVRRGLVDETTARTDPPVDEGNDDFATAGYGLWLIRKAHTHEPIGTAGLRRLDDRGLDLFYSITPEHRGHGYATEAARGVVEFAVASLGWIPAGPRLDPGWMK